MAEGLSPAKCTLLAIHNASAADVKALHSLSALRHDALPPELLLRVLLTYLPESVEPREYTALVDQVISGAYRDDDRGDVHLDLAPVKDLDEEQARKRVKKAKLLPLKAHSTPPDSTDDIATDFLRHRALRLDSETGLLNLVPQLVEPFLPHHENLASWYIGYVLPLLRLQFEYYPHTPPRPMTLARFEELDAQEVVDFLLSHSLTVEADQHNEIGRDIRGLVGPWAYGHTGRKRRKLSSPHDSSIEDTGDASAAGVEQSEHVWDPVFQWMVLQSHTHFPTITRAVEAWDGPDDVDLGGSTLGAKPPHLDADDQRKLRTRYVQTAFAACYVVEDDTIDTIRRAHSVMSRIAVLLDLAAPDDLDFSADALPKYTSPGSLPHSLDLAQEALLHPSHPITTPTPENYLLLQTVIYSAHVLSSLNYPISPKGVLQLRFQATSEEQTAVLQSLLRSLSKTGGRRDEALWTADRKMVLWLWDWGAGGTDKQTNTSEGVLGRISRQDLEETLLKSFIDTGCYVLAADLYLKSSDGILSHADVEQIVLAKTMEAYDGATNGNRTRGGMKKANDIISAFRSYFPRSSAFREALALITATHALSFYSLTLQHGIPFQPVSIRVSHDPVALLEKVLDQNEGSYTKLDDLIGIARNFITAGLSQANDSDRLISGARDADAVAKAVERRVTFMAVEAALHENDFETAYSYIVNRLTPSSADIKVSSDGAVEPKHARNASKGSSRSQAVEAEDDTSWRAAFLAGRFRPATSSSPSLRRLEQRTELLSLALLLAPVSALTEILAAWRRCEEEMTSLQLAQQQAEEHLDDRADKRLSSSSIPGNFTIQGEQPALLYNQKRREMGRMSGKPSGNEAPVSMFDLTRSAAHALSKNAFPLRGGVSSAADDPLESSVESLVHDNGTLEGEKRVRKRDMVTNVVSGGLASGLGWVLGATPVHQHTREDQT
ncbi:Sec39 domain-containing protein [Neohortaea acidophila]|uniref:Sec39 domain-containing protein n=1 Tax=Neohortaea acidophila TaxID=245834 RepID=A0A6A6Q3M5_9PEZI|nr:Sec39 domain-containing protein [Neohortaea acidophila]KAF2486624.1 Sec39 domain-containing protein [Neohortaea acidophila]